MLPQLTLSIGILILMSMNKTNPANKVHTSNTQTSHLTHTNSIHKEPIKGTQCRCKGCLLIKLERNTRANSLIFTKDKRNTRIPSMVNSLDQATRVSKACKMHTPLSSHFKT
jgi:hypothetical protein